MKIERIESLLWFLRSWIARGVTIGLLDVVNRKSDYRYSFFFWRELHYFFWFFQNFIFLLDSIRLALESFCSSRHCVGSCNFSGTKKNQASGTSPRLQPHFNTTHFPHFLLHKKFLNDSNNHGFLYTRVILSLPVPNIMLTFTSFLPTRALLFDMDGLLINSEDKYSLVTNQILAKYNKPPLPWSIKAQMQGRPGPTSAQIFYKWAQLPVTPAEYQAEQFALQTQIFPTVGPLPGVEKLLEDLKTARTKGEGKEEKVHVALATSSHKATFDLKTGHLEELFTIFEPGKRVLGDDIRIPKGRGKPAPEIYLLALKVVNEHLAPGEKPITPAECLVFEDSVPGVESGRRAGMRVVWCPHPELKNEYKGREDQVLAGLTGEGEGDEHQVGKVGDGWADYYETLEGFPWAKYGIVV